MGNDARRTSSVSTQIAALILLVIGRSTAGAQEPEQARRMRTVAAAEATARLTLSSSNQGASVRPEWVELLTSSAGITGAAAWRLRWGHHTYLMVTADSQVIRAGGFQGPDAASVWRLVVGTAGLPSSILDQARTAALLLDPNGAEQVSARSGDVAVGLAVKGMEASLPRGWPRDSIVRLDDGDTAIVVTMFSRDVHTFDQEWYAIAHSFVMREGKLLAWVTHRSEPLLIKRGRK